MLNLDKFYTVRITGNGKYDCLVSPSGMIVSEEPGNGYLHGKNLQDVYDRFKGKIIIGPISVPVQPILLDSEIYPKMLEKNLSLGYLKEKFNCEIL